ncbi:MAG TPA: hypothetical protein VF638_00910 [Sphingomonas sp.]
MIANLRAKHAEVHVSGFFRALATVGEYMADLIGNDPEWRRGVSIVPDAFAIDRVGKHVIVFEIVDTHDVSDEKLAKIEEIGWALDQDGYDIGVIRIDRHGSTLIDPVGDALTRLSPVDAA